MAKHLLNDLDRLSDDLLRITQAVEDALSLAISGVLSRNIATCQNVVQGDIAIDQMEVELEESALKILALHQPVAGDLRFIVAAIKINNDLERIADHASNLAKRGIEFGQLAAVEAPPDFDKMADIVRSMVRLAIQSLVQRDAGLARQVIENDDIVDDFNREIIAGLRDRIETAQKEQIDPLLRWVTSVRGLERIGDLATNIAEDVLYLVSGEIVRHQGGA